MQVHGGEFTFDATKCDIQSNGLVSPSYEDASVCNCSKAINTYMTTYAPIYAGITSQNAFAGVCFGLAFYLNFFFICSVLIILTNII